MIALHPIASDGVYEAWTYVRNVVVPNEPMTVEQVRRHDGEPDRLALLAEPDGALAGCGVVGRSSSGGRVFIAQRVLPDQRSRGVGRALVAALAGHARGVGYDGANAFESADEPHSNSFARGYGLDDVDFQLEQARTVDDESEPSLPAGIRLVPLGGERERVLREEWPVARDGYADMKMPQPIEIEVDEWLRDEATLAAGSFAATRGMSSSGTPVRWSGRTPAQRSTASPSSLATGAVAGSAVRSSWLSCASPQGTTCANSSRGRSAATRRCSC